MKKNILTCTLFSAVILFTACNEGGSSQFATRADSVNFAKAVAARYPEVCRESMLGDTLTETKGMQLIPWDTVLAYKNYYDQNPLLKNPSGQPYKGYNVDANGYKLLQANTPIKGLYLRLGRKGNGEYTIMVLGTDAQGNLLQTSALGDTSHLEANPGSNYDNLNPCPTNCPTNIDSIP